MNFLPIINTLLGPLNVSIVEHPLIAHKLSLMRQKETPTNVFRQLTKEIARCCWRMK